MKKVVWLIVACMMAACGGGEQKQAASKTPNVPSAVSPGSSATAATATAQPITGKTWDVKMIGDASGYHFDPASLTIKPGDGVRWTVVSGPPHNVTFWSDSIPSASTPTLAANMPQTMAPLTAQLLTNIGQTYTVSFGGVAPGTYRYYCTPHLALGMKGVIVVQ